MTETVVVTPPRRRRRGPVIIIAVVVTLVVLVVGFIALDSFARQQVADYVADKTREALALESDAPVAVDVAGTSVIAQLVTGSLERIEVDVDDVAIGELTGDISLRADGVPVDSTRAVDRVLVEFRAPEDGIQSIASTLSSSVLGSSAIDSVELLEGEVRFGTEFSVFGIPFDVAIGVEPFADDGQIAFTPTSVEIGGTRSSVDALVDQFGSPAEQLLQSRSLCVATWLPQSLSVEDVVVTDDELVLTIGGSKILLDEKSLSTLGSCDGQG